MPRTIRNAQLETRAARDRLKTREKPYYQALDEGLHLGYRRNRVGGKWVMRLYLGEQRYEVETLAIADDYDDADGVTVLNYRQAQLAARAAAKERALRSAGIIVKEGPYTVADAIEDYLTWMATQRKSARETRIRAEAFILPPLGRYEVAKLTTRQLRSWLDELAATPARVRTPKGEPQRYRDDAPDDPVVIRRRRARANRILTILKAALNHAWREGLVESDTVWRRLKPFSGTDANRQRYLTIDEARRLINACTPEFRPLVQAALATGARYGELAALRCEDFNRDRGTVHVKESKAGKPRHIVLTPEGIQLFERLTAGRPGNALILTRASGKPWARCHQHRFIVNACRQAAIEPAISFHILRHTYASLAAMNGLPLLVLAQNLGHRDTKMVERHYGHLANDYVNESIRSAAPQFGLADDDNVTVLKQRG